MAEPVRVGLVDSGCRTEQRPRVEAARSFHLDAGRGVVVAAAQPDRLGHGSSLLEVIARQAPRATFLVAQVFTTRWATSAAQVAAAIGWLVEQQAQVINLSLGLRQDRPVLRLACERATRGKVVVCAAAPARGEPVYPASYPGVMRMTGDARCQAHQLSYLGTPHADFAGCVQAPGTGIAGASVGCAHMTGHVARYLSQGGGLEELVAWLVAEAAFVGPERRRA